MGKVKDIREALGTRLAAITVANGYNTDAGDNLQEGFLPVRDSIPFPALILYQAGGSRDHTEETSLRRVESIITFGVVVAVLSGDADKADDIDDILDDVVKAVEGDQTLGGLGYVTATSGRAGVLVESWDIENSDKLVEKGIRQATATVTVSYVALLADR
jgi:hypothetical protein